MLKNQFIRRCRGSASRPTYTPFQDAGIRISQFCNMAISRDMVVFGTETDGYKIGRNKVGGILLRPYPKGYCSYPTRSTRVHDHCLNAESLRTSPHRLNSHNGQSETHIKKTAGWVSHPAVRVVVCKFTPKFLGVSFSLALQIVHPLWRLRFALRRGCPLDR